MWSPLIPARAAALWHEPCHLNELITYGNYIGVDAALFPEFMWLVNVALTPELPVGWLHRSRSDGTTCSDSGARTTVRKRRGGSSRHAHRASILD